MTHLAFVGFVWIRRRDEDRCSLWRLLLLFLTAGLNPLGQAWLIWGQGLFIASGVIWAAILIPTQIAQARAARSFAHGGPIPESYWQLNRRWIVWGTVATVLPLANLYFMVFKP